MHDGYSDYLEKYFNKLKKYCYIIYSDNKHTILYSGRDFNIKRWMKYKKALDFVKRVANKSLQGNVLSSIGNAGKTIGNLTEKVQIIKEKIYLQMVK